MLFNVFSPSSVLRKLTVHGFQEPQQNMEVMVSVVTACLNFSFSQEKDISAFLKASFFNSAWKNGDSRGDLKCRQPSVSSKNKEFSLSPSPTVAVNKVQIHEAISFYIPSSPYDPHESSSCFACPGLILENNKCDNVSSF